MRDAVICEPLRTPVGGFGGSLRDVAVQDLASTVIRALMERNLVKIAGREEIPGSPLQYGTTKEFLDTFGINSLEDLPRPEEVK